MVQTPVSPYDRRPMVRYHVSPHRSVSPATHSGLIFASSGQLHSGGRQHAGRPRDHEVINPARAPTNEPAPIFSVGQTFDRNVVSLPVSRRATDSPRRAERPTLQYEPPTPTGRKHITPRESGNVVAPHRGVGSDGPERARIHHKISAAAPSDNFIPGVSSSRVADSPVRERATGVKHLTGPPQFVPPPFEKRPYQPHLRRVESRPADNIAGGSATGPGIVRDPTPVRNTRRMSPAPSSRSFNIISNADC